MKPKKDANSDSRQVCFKSRGMKLRKWRDDVALFRADFPAALLAARGKEEPQFQGAHSWRYDGCLLLRFFEDKIASLLIAWRIDCLDTPYTVVR